MKKKKKIGRPVPWLLYPAALILGIIYRIKYRLRIDRSGIKGIKGPALVLCPHVSGKDHILTALALMPRRPTYVLSYHFWAIKPLRVLVRLMHGIPKRMYCADGGAILGIMRAIKEKNIVVLFPEGRLTWYGESLNLTDGTAELVKKLRVPVYTIVSEGAGKCFPKWAVYPRRGRISVRTGKLLDPGQIEEMTTGEIRNLLEKSLSHSEESAMPGERYVSKDLSAGLDGIIWKCPECGAEKTLVTSGGHIKCVCGMDAVLDEYGKISGAQGIKTASEWYLYCENGMDLSAPFSRQVSVAAEDGDGYLRKNVGRGVLTLDGEKTEFRGTVNGKEEFFAVPVSAAPAFPVSVASHVDMYHDNRLYKFSPVQDPREAIMFVAYREKQMKQRRNEKE